MKGQWTVTDTRLSQSCVFVGHTSDIGYTRVQRHEEIHEIHVVCACFSKQDRQHMYA